MELLLVILTLFSFMEADIVTKAAEWYLSWAHFHGYSLLWCYWEKVSVGHFVCWYCTRSKQTRSNTSHIEHLNSILLLYMLLQTVLYQMNMQSLWAFTLQTTDTDRSRNNNNSYSMCSLFKLHMCDYHTELKQSFTDAKTLICNVLDLQVNWGSYGKHAYSKL